MTLWVLFLTGLFAIINLVLIAWTALRRISLEQHRTRIAERASHWRPILEEWLWNPEAASPPETVTEDDRAAVEQVLVPYLELLRGADKIRLAFFLAQNGYLKHRLKDLESKRWWIRAKAATALGLIGMVESCRSLEPLLEDPHPLVRQAAIRALGRLAHPESLSPLLKAVERQDNTSREYLVGALRALGPAAIASQQAILERPGSSEAHRVAARVLRDVADPAVAKVLAIAVRRNADPELVHLALESLAEVGGADPEEAEQAALSALPHPNAGIRQRAVQVLGRWGSDRSLTPLAATLSDDSWNVRRAAAAALHQAGPQAFQHLTEGLKLPKAAEVISEEAQIAGLLADVLAQLDRHHSAWPLAEALIDQLDLLTVQEALEAAPLQQAQRERLQARLSEESLP